MDDGTRITEDVEKFLRAARSRDTADCSRMLKEKPELVNSVEAGGYAALHFAAFNGDAEMIRLLLEYKADLSIENLDGNTPLVMGVKGRQLECIRILANAGADVNKESPSGSAAAHYAASMGYLDCLRLLVELGAKTIYGENEAGTLLHWACHSGDVNCIGAVIYEFKVPINAVDKHGGTALFTAIFMKKMEAAEFLIEHGATVNIAIANDGSTPLHIAVEHADSECVRLLCSCGADASAKNEEGKTPLELAKAANKTNAVKELEKAQVPQEKRADEAARFKNQGNKVFQQGENVKAAKFYTLSIHLDPTNHVYYSNRAACYFNQHFYTGAYWDALRCIALDPSWPKGYLRKAATELALKKYSDALTTASQGLKLDPTNKDLQQVKDEAFKMLKR
ncbi:ankyrin/TPR repeat protein [Leishmania mexicana MHOM/GT/2001/U1103]|uniref:Ankyrin/TPR repeat protein n=1 Tax=Leishmania mexicana (strain MHOM/GT/2001/U1103) TaxID=929439 RepID=E9AWK3_LEIMU|nr:ankyrin/TPR repeat protein [Leishmania mexicana MHOM/GT/2001/U1103]CBZ27339.1 ankyrin/TPR repeat protein [Leishmania mexicana MHOM/GT/2001/U1103]